MRKFGILSCLLAFFCMAGFAGSAPDMSGNWSGVISVPGGPQLHVALHLKQDASGKVSGSFESVDQGATLSMADVSVGATEFRFDIPRIGGAYQAKWDAAKSEWLGTWTQGAASLPLNLSRETSAAKPAARPQVPKKPYPYEEKQVSFHDGAIRLAGTLTIPNGTGPFPAVVLIAGSGKNTRDENVFGHPVFLVLADYLTRHGIAVLRYDKRGAGASSGDFAAATTDDFADDAAAAFAFLKVQPGIDKSHIGLIGHSEGGVIAPVVAAKHPGVAFMVLMAGPGVSGGKLLRAQKHALNLAGGMPQAQMLRVDGEEDQLIHLVETAQDRMDGREAMTNMLTASGVAENQARSISGELFSPWMYRFIRLDPVPALKMVKCPVLALIGSKDLQVPADQNLPALRTAFAGNPVAEVDEMADLNHLFQPAKTGLPTEYHAIPTTIAPVALKKITGWIKDTVQK